MPYKNKVKKQGYQKKYQEKHRESLAIYQKRYKSKNKERLMTKFRQFKREKQEAFVCKYCKKEFKRRIYDSRDKGKFCSSKCALSKVRTRKHQVEAGKLGAKAVIAKYRGTGTKGYIRELTGHQHRIVAEKMLGRKLRKGEIVHHKDENKHNNKPENLEVMTQAEHCRLHFKKNDTTAV